MNRTIGTLALALLSTLTTWVCGVSAAPTDEAAFDAWKRASLTERSELIKDGWYALRILHRSDEIELYNRFMAQLNPAALEPSQWAWIQANFMLDYTWLGDEGKDFTQAALAVAEQRKSSPDAQGAAATVLWAKLTLRSRSLYDHELNLARAVLTHPGLQDAVRTGKAPNLNSFLASLSDEIQAELLPELIAYCRSLRDADVAMALESEYLYQRLSKQLTDQNETREEIRQSLLAIVSRALKSAQAGDDADTTAGANMYQLMAKTLELAPSVSKLVGARAPEIEFLWSSSSQPIRTLADLKGKVVLLDFWATWCGPCISVFPDLRAITKHYQGFPVVVLGVTSPQGLTYDSSTKRHQVAQTYEQEFRQMVDYMKTKNITWTVAFSKEHVFNPSYGVTGIPHTVLIDPAGVIRQQGLHLGRSRSEAASLIDAILKEFELPVPERSIEDPN